MHDEIVKFVIILSLVAIAWLYVTRKQTSVQAAPVSDAGNSTSWFLTYNQVDRNGSNTLPSKIQGSNYASGTPCTSCSIFPFTQTGQL